MKQTLFVLLLGFVGACDLAPFEVPADDAGVTMDTGAGEKPCTEWGMNSHGQRFCLSTEPVACPGPWPCK